MTLHLVGLPHTQLDADRYSACAFTAKTARLRLMLDDLAVQTLTYWGASGDVPIGTESEQVATFGAWNPARLPVIEWDAQRDYWRTFHGRIVDELDRRLAPGDMIGFVGGAIASDLAARYRDRFVILEPGIGYEGAMPSLAFGCYESYAWMHNRYGALGVADGRHFDTVIPNALFPDDWRLGTDGGYLLFVGRLIARKGPHVAAQIAAAAGLPLLVAGAGAREHEPGRIACEDGTVVEGAGVRYVGSVSGAERRDLFAGATALLAPTAYIGPWEGVAAESLASGVPAITPDFGAFVEYVPERFRFRSMAQALDAVDAAPRYRGQALRSAMLGYAGRERCQRLYGQWLARLATLTDGSGGWYAPRHSCVGR